MSDTVAARRAIAQRVLEDPPLVHRSKGETMVWRTGRGCYELMAERCPPGARTLETGLGVSTALFAALGAVHTCAVASQPEVDRLLAHCRSRGIDTTGIRFAVGPTEATLPSLPPDELDLILIDGGHGFPVPEIDWFYGASRLRRGGLLVVDDVSLPAVSILVDFLDKDPRWKTVERTSKWVAYEREDEGALGEDWWQQRHFYGPREPSWVALRARRLLGRLRRLARRGGRTDPGADVRPP